MSVRTWLATASTYSASVLAWVRFASTTAPGDIFIAHSLSAPWLISVQHAGVAREFGPSTLPGPGASTQVFLNLTELHRAIARTYQLSVSLPQLPLQSFEGQTEALPRETEADRVVIARVGQDIFRQALMEYWNGTCPLTGITDPALLRASHIVPWAECENDALRLNVYNGLLLSSLWDAAFDAGLVSFTQEGVPIVSSSLSSHAAEALGLNTSPVLERLTPQHDSQLKRHREKHKLTERGT
ncbi:HNH endonuclease [Edaphobacter modestus]|nr:HNH endonuclease signature motif containing protein [Edaphobacter modestus]